MILDLLKLSYKRKKRALLAGGNETIIDNLLTKLSRLGFLKALY